MTLRLIVIRHAKSDWGDATLDDHDRPLNKRGQRDAPRIGAWLEDMRFGPDAALVSSATRARQTWDGVATGLSDTPKPVIEEKLYHPAPDTILSFARRSSSQTQAIVAHNPGIGMFAQSILNASPDHYRFQDYPTAATLVVEFDEHEWRDIHWGSGRCLAFITPHDL